MRGSGLVFIGFNSKIYFRFTEIHIFNKFSLEMEAMVVQEQCPIFVELESFFPQCRQELVYN